MAALLFILALVLVARSWRDGRRADPAAVPRLLVRFGIACVLASALVPLATLTSGAFAAVLTVALAGVSLLAFDALVGLANWKPARVPSIVRAVFAFAAIVATLSNGPLQAIAFSAFAAVFAYRWRTALDTRSLFLTFLGSVALMALFLAPIPDGGPGFRDGPLAGVARFARITLGMASLYVLVGIFKSFTAFVRDPSLGIRTVTRRLALSHVLVLVVPLAITIALWVSTTYLGVNGERALAGQRLLEHDSGLLATGLRSAVSRRDDGAAALRFAREQDLRWPGTRLWLDRGRGLERVFGDSVPGESRIAGWTAGLDSLPDHGVVGLRGRRWVGATARGDDAVPAVLLAPVRSVVDSTLRPVLGAEFSMRERNNAETETLSDSLPETADTLSAFQRDLDDLRASSRRRGRRVQFSRREGSAPVVVGTTTESDTNATMAFRGIAIVPGAEHDGRRWRSAQFMLVARADLGTTLAGLFANVQKDPLQAVPIVMLGLLVLLLLPVAIMDFSMVRGMGRSIADAIAALRDGAAALGRGELAHRIEIRGNDDLWDTARQFNRMAEGLERGRALEKEAERLESELELARRIQRRLLPGEPPAVPGLEIAGRYEPAREVGGDYYDHFDLGGGRVLLVIADVSGKGVPAALLMSGFRASLMSQDQQGLGPEKLAERVNDFLHRSVESGKFVTAFLGFLDAASGRLAYANAGHNPPALLRRDGRVEWLAAGGVVLGIMPQFRFDSGEAVLEPGDLLALYTDGVTEGTNAAGELWGDDRLVATLRRLATRPCAEAAEALVREVRAFEGEAGAADDITVLMARRVPA